ncbi:hypothetical protein [Bartonella sp. AP4SXKL]|uniref:hypothetical protein n=1 Tax=Bartonella sp. AP4SXKL TaxID=3243496 RepID=UPI0035D02E17
MDIAWGVVLQVGGVFLYYWHCRWVGTCGSKAYGLEHALVLEQWGVCEQCWTCSFFCFGGGTLYACTVGVVLKKNEHFSFPRAWSLMFFL